MAGRAGYGRRDRPVFMRKFAMRDPPMVTAVTGQYRIAGMRVHHTFRRAHDAVYVGEPNFDLALQFSRLDMFGIARELGGVAVLPATAKYQLIASFVILFTAGIIHNKQPAVLSE